MPCMPAPSYPHPTLPDSHTPCDPSPCNSRPPQRTYAEEGLPPYNMDGLTGNTLNSHRLLLWAAEAHGLQAQNRLVDELFKVGGRPVDFRGHGARPCWA